MVLKSLNYQEGVKLSGTYNVIAGDTFESIARKKYGTEFEANRIAQANPGSSEPLTPGISLIIPVLLDVPQNLQQQAISINENEVALLIDGKRFRYWESMQIRRSIDSMDTLEFDSPFDVDIPGFKETFRPFSYKTVVVTVGGNPLFTGVIVGINPDVDTDKKIIMVNGYSLPGVLNDCTPPASSFPLEFDDQGLREIAKTLVIPFGLDVDFQVNQGAVFERVALKPKKKILVFLIELAKQRNLIISSTSEGKLLFQQSINVGNPVAQLQQGSSPVVSVKPLFNPQEYYSHVTGLEPVFIGLSGSQFTVKNPHLGGVIRPYTFDVPDTVDADIKVATEAKVGRMFGNTAVYSVRVDTWRDSSDNLWKPNTTVKLVAPDAMIYNDYEFIIRSVEFARNQASESAILDLAIPGSFKGEIPEALPWDE